MNFMAAVKKATKKAAKKVAKKVAKAVKGSPEWLAQKAEARKKLDNRA